MANRSPETTANGQSSETTVRVLLRFCSNRFYQAVETLNCFHAYPFLGSSQCIQWVILISVEMLMIDEEFVRNEEEQAVERIEGNGRLLIWCLGCWRLKDGDEASLEKIHHLGPTENGQIDFMEM
ncbi:hypothetical protein YC2023_032574 [Brassica napus]